MPPALIDSLLHDGGGLRPIWKIALYFFFFSLLTIVGQYAVSVLPPHPLQWASLAVTTAAALLAAWIMLSKLDRRPLGALGFPLHRQIPRESLLSLGLGGGLIGLAVAVLFALGAARFLADSGTIPGYLSFLGWTFAYFSLAAAFEEILFRGYPFQVLVVWIGPWPATLGASALFAFLHGQNPNVTPLALANIFLAGVLLSIAYLRTRSLWFATGVHIGWNWTMASLLDFPVSGLTFDTPLYSGVPAGHELLTGGAFGPEAGLAGTLVLLIGILLVRRAPWIRPAAAAVESGPVVDTRLDPERW